MQIEFEHMSGDVTVATVIALSLSQDCTDDIYHDGRKLLPVLVYKL